MQSWPNSGQNGANDGGHNSWQSGFAYSGQNGQFDPNQTWSQPGSDQAAAYSHLNATDASASGFFDTPHQGAAFLGANLHGTPSPQSSFHTGSLPLSQQYSQPSQDVIDPAFSSMHTDLYGHQQRGNLGADAMGHIAQVSNHSHAGTQAFPQHEFSFTPQSDQPFDPDLSYAPTQLLPQVPRQDSQTPVQQHFENLHGGFAQNQRYSQPSPQQQASVQHQPSQAYPQNQSYAPVISGQRDQYPVNGTINYQQNGQPYALQPDYAQQKPLAYSQASRQNPSAQQLNTQPQPLQHTSALPPSRPAPTTTQSAPSALYLASQQPLDLEASANPDPIVESAPKRRKRINKGSPDVITKESTAPLIEMPADVAGKRLEDIDALPVPVPSDQELVMMTQFAKRSRAAQVRYPSIQGPQHLVYDGSIKLPTPKSYDKLSPFVALPSRNGRSIFPELGSSLPCEIQGRFTSQYRPSMDKGGLDERREEAKILLDDFDHSMKTLGKKRPKYTEYPHAFKEQLKSDEASKNKAEKKAKKELEDEQTKPIRAATCPADPVEAAVWETIGIVHIDPSINRSNAIVAGRVRTIGDLFIKLRNEMNRSKTEADQAMKDKIPLSELNEIKREAEIRKEAFYRVLDATIEHADDAVLDNLGGHQKLVLCLVNAMIGSIKGGDFSGKLPKAILELFTHFRMTKKIAETTNFETVRKRFEDKGDDEVKEMVREIAANIKKAAKGLDPDTATGYTGTSAASRAKANAKASADSSTSTKRGRDEDSDSRTVKKIAVESGAGSLSKKLAQPKIASQTATRPTVSKPSVSSLLPGKARPVPKPAASKPEMSGTDNSSASVDDKSKPEQKKPTASKTEVKAPIPKPAPSTGAGSLSGIASLLDSINAPKMEATTPTRDTKDSDTPEAPEERAKRLRKEARRKLRVSWKAEPELVQVRIFQKDDQEDEGRESNMIRDAADDRSEGMVLKQRANVEDEDDDDDIPYQPWLGPAAIDFSSLPDDARNKNYVTRGGTVPFSTEEQQRIAEREQQELMAIYTDAANIPPTPKSPPPELALDIAPKAGYLPREGSQFEEIQSRWRDEQQFGMDEALRASVRRLDTKHSFSGSADSIMGRIQKNPTATESIAQAISSTQAHQPLSNNTIPLVSGAETEEQVLGWIMSEKIKAWRDVNPAMGDYVRAYNYTDQTVQMMGAAIESVVKSLIGKPFPAESPPQWMSSDEERVREWWLAFNKEVAARQKRADEDRAKAEAEAHAFQAAANQTQSNSRDWSGQYAQQQQQQYAPYMALLQQMTGGQPGAQQSPAAAPQPSQIPDSQLQSILAAINQPHSQSTQAQAPANSMSYLNTNDTSYQQLLMLTQMAQNQAQQSGQPPQNHGNDRDWDRHDHGRGDGFKDNGKEGRKKKGTLPPHKPANKALIGTKPCTFWQQGKCARGDKCTFRHG